MSARVRMITGDLGADLTPTIDTNVPLLQYTVEFIECPPLGLQVDVAVDVHGHLQGAVSDDLHHGSRVDPVGQQEGHAGVPLMQNSA